MSLLKKLRNALFGRPVARSAVTDLTGLTWDQAAKRAKAGSAIAHVEWKPGWYALYQPNTGRFIKVVGDGVFVDDWQPTVGERYGGCCWSVVFRYVTDL